MQTSRSVPRVVLTRTSETHESLGSLTLGVVLEAELMCDCVDNLALFGCQLRAEVVGVPRSVVLEDEDHAIIFKSERVVHVD